MKCRQANNGVPCSSVTHFAAFGQQAGRELARTSSGGPAPLQAELWCILGAFRDTTHLLNTNVRWQDLPPPWRGDQASFALLAMAAHEGKKIWAAPTKGQLPTKPDPIFAAWAEADPSGRLRQQQEALFTSLRLRRLEEFSPPPHYRALWGERPRQ